MRYDKNQIEIEAIKSAQKGRITEPLGAFILQRALEQALIDAAVMRTCEKFLIYYEEGKSAANLIISIIYSTMTNRIVSLKWKDVYGKNIKGNIVVIENGERVTKLIRYTKDDYLSEKL